MGPSSTVDSGTFGGGTTGGVSTGGPAGTTSGTGGALAGGALSGGSLSGGSLSGGSLSGGALAGGALSGGSLSGGSLSGGSLSGGSLSGGALAGGSLSGGSTAGSDSGAPGSFDAGVGTSDSGTDESDAGSSSSGGGFIRGPEPTTESASKAGPYKVGNTTQGLRDGPKYAEQTLWWPQDAEPPFAFLAIVPGYVSTENDIKPWGPFFASHGLVVLTIGTNSPATDLPPDRRDALLDALETLRQENTREGSPVKGKLDFSRQATMGWSMGGGGTLLAAEQTPTLKATISMAAWNPNYQYKKLTVPALMFAAKGDNLAGGQSQGFYESTPNSTPKELFEVPGEGLLGGHMMFNNPANRNGEIGRYGLSWFKVFLEGDERYKQFLKVKPQNATDFRNNL